MKDETTVLTAARDKKDKDVEKRLTRLEAMVRKLKANSEIHWGKDVDGDGILGFVSPKLLAVLTALLVGSTVIAVYAADVLVDWASGQHSSATAQVTLETDGTAMLRVNGISNLNSKVTVSNLVVKGTTTFPSANIAAASIAGGTLTGMTLDTTSKVNASVVSNENGTVKGSNIVVSANGAFAVGSGATVSLPSASVASTALPSIIANSAFSNVNGRVNCSNLTVAAGSTVTVPAGSIVMAAIAQDATIALQGSNCVFYGAVTKFINLQSGTNGCVTGQAYLASWNGTNVIAIY